MKLNYQLPQEYRMSEKEQEEMTEEITIKTRKLTGIFLKGIFFFITIPITIIKKIKQKRKCKSQNQT